MSRERTLREQQEINRRTMERKEKERQKIEQEKRKEKEEEDALEQVSDKETSWFFRFYHFFTGKASHAVSVLSVFINVNSSSSSPILILVITVICPILPTFLTTTFSIYSYSSSVSKSR